MNDAFQKEIDSSNIIANIVNDFKVHSDYYIFMTYDNEIISLIDFVLIDIISRCKCVPVEIHLHIEWCLANEYILTAENYHVYYSKCCDYSKAYANFLRNKKKGARS